LREVLTKIGTTSRHTFVATVTGFCKPNFLGDIFMSLTDLRLAGEEEVVVDHLLQPLRNEKEFAHVRKGDVIRFQATIDCSLVNPDNVEVINRSADETPKEFF